MSLMNLEIFTVYFSFYFLQFANGWVHGEQLCEASKIHPLLKAYKGLTEKVKPPLIHGVCVNVRLIIWFTVQSYLWKNYIW